MWRWAFIREVRAAYSNFCDDTHWYTDARTHRHSHACANTDANARTHRHSHACANTDANARTHRHSHACANTDANARTHRHSHACANTDANARTHRHSHACANTDANARTHRPPTPVPTLTPTPVPTDTPTPVPTLTPTPVPTDTPTPVPTLTPTPVPTDTPTPTPEPTATPTPAPSSTLASLYETRNTRWLVWAHPTVARQIQDLTWVADGLSDLERSAVDELIYMAVAEIANLEAGLALSWVQDGISETEYEALDRLGALDYRNIKTLSAVLTLPWVQDGIGDADYEAIDALAVLDYRSPASTPLAITVPWVQDGVSATEYDIKDWLGRLSDDAPEAAHQVLTMPFLDSPDTTDVLALRGMNKLADQGALDALTEHPIFWDGITEDDTILIAASGTLYSTPDEIRHVLELGPASIETESLGTDLTPNLKISIVRTDSPAKPDTIEATRDLVEFVENTMGLPLSVGRTGRNQEPKLIPRSLRPTAWGWCTSERPRLR